MNHLKNTKFALLSLAVGGLVAATAMVHAQQNAASTAVSESMEEATREIRIMHNIFAAALDDNARRNRFRIGAGEALYLAGQGMVFTFHLNGGGGFYVSGPNIVMPATPAPPVFVRGGDFDFDFDFDFDYDFDFDFDENGFNRAASEQQREYQQRLQDMSEEMRDKQEELQDAQREVRELQRESRRDPDVDNDARIDELNASIEAIMEDFQNQANTMQTLQQEYQAERQAAFEAARTEQTALIFSTLCDYGNTLRSLESGEHVTIVFRNYADNQTQINVFDYADISSCSSADALRQAATTYIQDNRGF